MFDLKLNKSLEMHLNTTYHASHIEKVEVVIFGENIGQRERNGTE